MRSRDAIEKSAAELQLHVERHRRLLLSVLEEHPEAGEMDICPYMDCLHERRLQQALVEVIKVLEHTRKAFKSKQLEELRKKMLRVLAEAD